MGKRREARETVLSVLYYYEIDKCDITKLLEQIPHQKDVNKKLSDYIKRLIEATIKNLDTIDKKVKKAVENWDMDRIAIVDKSILRFATAEILYFPDIPIKVSIDEAVEIAKKFSTEKSGAFINGILDKIARSENLLEKRK